MRWRDISAAGIVESAAFCVAPLTKTPGTDLIVRK